MYAHEEDEWRREVASMSEMQRAIALEDPHAWNGVHGDREDAREDQRRYE